MPTSAPDEFEHHRPMLEGLAYRMCGVMADAQDIVQETHIKWCAADRAQIANPRAWLVTVCSRLAMDLLKSARVRREHYVGPWLPEPLVAAPGKAPDEQAQIDDSISIALMLAMERLTPAERAAFLLHDVFEYDFDAVAAIIGKTEVACRQLASRARRAVREERPRFAASPETHRRLLDAFLGAVRSGDSDGLKTLLAESVELHSDGGGHVKTAPDVLHGREAVAAFFLEVWRQNVPDPTAILIRRRWFNGAPGLLLFQGNRLQVALSLAVEGDRIGRLFALRNPEKLKRFAASLDHTFTGHD